jgi:hypothetical protein
MSFSYLRDLILYGVIFGLMFTASAQTTTNTKTKTQVNPNNTSVNAPSINNSVNYLPDVRNELTPIAISAPRVDAPVIQSTPQGGSGVALSENNLAPTAEVKANSLDQRGLYSPTTVTEQRIKNSTVSQVTQVSTHFMLPALPPDKEVVCMPPGAKPETVARVLIESGALWGVNHVPSRVKNEKGEMVVGLQTQRWADFSSLPYKRKLIQRPGAEPFELLLGLQWVYTRVLVASNAGGHVSGSFAGSKGLSVGSGTTIGVTDVVQLIDYKGQDCVHNWAEYNLYLDIGPDGRDTRGMTLSPQHDRILSASAKQTLKVERKKEMKLAQR